MADESYSAVYPGSKINYTLPAYLDYLHQLKRKATELCNAGKIVYIVNVIHHCVRGRPLECAQRRIGTVVIPLY